MTPNGEPTLGEIGRALAELKEDLRELKAELVHREVYASDQRLVDLRLMEMDRRCAGIEARASAAEEERKGLRRLVTGAALSGGAAILAQLLQGVLNS